MGCLNKVKEVSFPYYLSILRGRMMEFISFYSALVLCETQSASSRYRTCVAVSISYDDNHYTTGIKYSYRGGARGVMVIVLGNGHGDTTRQIVFHRTLIPLGKV